MTEFLEGEVYYRLKYSDAARFYPIVETFIFIGKNLSGEDHEDTWYFQFSDGYVKFGSVRDSQYGDRKVCCVTNRDVEDMLGLVGLTRELEMAVKRRHVARG